MYTILTEPIEIPYNEKKLIGGIEAGKGGFAILFTYQSYCCLL